MNEVVWERWAAQPPARWKPEAKGFSGRYLTRGGDFDGWIGSSERGIVALIDKAPPWAGAHGWNGSIYRLPLRWPNQTAARFRMDAQQFLDERAVRNGVVEAPQIVDAAEATRGVQTVIVPAPQKGAVRMESYEVRKIDENRAEMLRETNAAMRGADAMHEIAHLIRSLSEDLQTVERDQSETIRRMPKRLVDVFEKARAGHYDSGSGLRFWSLGLAGPATARMASDLAFRDMQRVGQEIQQVLGEEGAKLNDRMMSGRTKLIESALALLAAAPKPGNALDAFQRLLLASRNGVAAGGE